MTRRKKLAAGGAALAVAAAAVAVAIASPATDLTGVPSANTRSQGYAPASMLSPELEQIALAQGSTKVENPDPATISYYGYDNDKLNAAGQPIMVASAAKQGTLRRTRPSLTRTSTSSSTRASPEPTRPTTTARASCSRGTRAVRPASRVP